MPDFLPDGLHLSYPGNLAAGLAALMVMALAALLMHSRHGVWRTVAALGVRALALGVLALLLAIPARTVHEVQTFEPDDPWRLFTEAPDSLAEREFHEPLPEFLRRARAALHEGAPPQSVEIHGPHADAVAARDAVRALGIPATAVWPDDAPDDAPVLIGMDAPRHVQPGEPVDVMIDARGGTLELLVNGEVHGHDSGVARLTGLEPGRHVVEARLLDSNGRELQRLGRVVRVSEPPLLLTLGLEPAQRAHAETVAPDWRHEHAGLEDFSPGRLADASDRVGVVLTSAHALYRLADHSEHSYALARWVARGGGLFVTGDGARYVAPEFLPSHVRGMLPVVLQTEAEPPDPEDPPVEEEHGVAEIAKVSLIFVVDRSGSMNLPAPGGGTRWNMAVRSVVESLRVLERSDTRESEVLNTRVGVMAFTLSQNWVMKPQNVLPFDRRRLERDLLNLPSDRVFDEAGSNTDIYAAMEDALQVMSDEPSAVRVIINLSDGGDRPRNIREGRHLRHIRERAIAKGINIVAVGIGDDFDGDSPEAGAARAAIEDMATRPQFAYIPGSAADHEMVRVIFVDTVETAFRAYDQQQEEKEEERRRRQEELEQEPETVDVMPGDFRLLAGPVAESVFGGELVPDDLPRAGWYASSRMRTDAVQVLRLEAPDEPPALAFGTYGLGRVGFWAVGSDPESLGELAGWEQYAAVVASAVRWLEPGEVPDVPLVGEAGPGGIRILDPLPDAVYSLRTDDAVLPLMLERGMLVGEGPLPVGAAVVLEQADDETREIGDVYIRPATDSGGHVKPLDDNPPPSALERREPAAMMQQQVWSGGLLLLAAMFLIVMPIERLIRVRS
jgi:hypothetical protein